MGEVTPGLQVWVLGSEEGQGVCDIVRGKGEGAVSVQRASELAEGASDCKEGQLLWERQPLNTAPPPPSAAGHNSHSLSSSGVDLKKLILFTIKDSPVLWP